MSEQRERTRREKGTYAYVVSRWFAVSGVIETKSSYYTDPLYSTSNSNQLLVFNRADLSSSLNIMLWLDLIRRRPSLCAVGLVQVDPPFDEPFVGTDNHCNVPSTTIFIVPRNSDLPIVVDPNSKRMCVIED